LRVEQAVVDMKQDHFVDHQIRRKLPITWPRRTKKLSQNIRPSGYVS
jgi:hypothetical protein